MRWRRSEKICAAAVRAAGLWLLSWTVNDPAQAAPLWALGVSALCTDSLACAASTTF
jgi:glycerophosphoryl diester phosphodiesterase